jgi:hypothetical protein
LKGYCITEEVQNLPDSPSNIRELNSQTYHVEKFFINACMYLACGDLDQHAEEVKSSMAHRPDDARKFFWDHMHKDLSMACRALNLTKDEIYHLLHKICIGFISITGVTDVKIDFDTKLERQSWETLFDKNFISPFLTVITRIFLCNLIYFL